MLVMEEMSVRKRQLSSDEDFNKNGAKIVTSSVAEYQIIEAPDWPSGVDFSKNDFGVTMRKRLLHWGPCSAIGITLLIGVSSTFLHIKCWPLTSFASLLHFTVFLFLNYCILLNLSRSAFIGPGYVPLAWYPPKKEHEASLQYCKFCEGFKPPRSHHCSKCGRCVLKMDHHCPWINNCVGHRNHSLFIRFLAAAVLGSAQAAFIIGVVLYRFLFRIRHVHFERRDEFVVHLSIYSFIFSVFLFGLAIGVIVSVGFLLIIQVRSALKNRTGIEDYIVDKANARDRSDDFEYPYHLGWRRNLSDVLFTSNGIPKGNGIWWPVRYPSTQFTFSEEQLIQKKIKRDHSFEVSIAHNFSGGYCSSIKFGPKIFLCQPWSDEKRTKVQEGERWLVTRMNKHWFYGFRIAISDVYNEKSAEQSSLNVASRGWFPRVCVHKI